MAAQSSTCSETTTTRSNPSSTSFHETNRYSVCLMVALTWECYATQAFPPTCLLMPLEIDRKDHNFPLNSLCTNVARHGTGLRIHRSRCHRRGVQSRRQHHRLRQVRLHDPEMVFDLPSGGKRLIQKLTATPPQFAEASSHMKNGVHTGEMPGRLIRGGQIEAL